MSEFGYVFGGEAADAGLIPAPLFHMLVAVIIGTMMAGTILLPVAGRLAEMVSQRLRVTSEETAATKARRIT
jgi:hypothetical protein